MPILVKCNSNDVNDTKKFQLTMRVEPGLIPVPGDEVYLWTSEMPRGGKHAKGKGLISMGRLLAVEPVAKNRLFSVKIELNNDIENTYFGMEQLKELASTSEPGHTLFSRLAPHRRLRIWGLSEEESNMLHSIFIKDKIKIGNTPEKMDFLNDVQEINASSRPETTKKALVDARLGQGHFRLELFKYWVRCPLTGCLNPTVLRASHIKPWRYSTDKERLDPYNGILLSPNLDVTFDAGLISFTNDGTLIVSSKLSHEDLVALGIPKCATIKLTSKHLKYMSFHREEILKK